MADRRIVRKNSAQDETPEFESPALSCTSQMTKTPAILLAALLALWGVLLFAVLSPDEAYPGAKEHSKQSEMLIAGAAAKFDAEMVGVGATAGVLIISVYVICLFLGAGRNGNSRRFVAVVAAAGSLVIGSFLAMAFSIPDYVSDSSPGLVAGFPVPTAWMVFGIWLTPVCFLAIYIGGYHRWVMTDADRQRLESLVAARADSADSTAQED